MNYIGGKNIVQMIVTSDWQMKMQEADWILCDLLDPTSNHWKWLSIRIQHTEENYVSSPCRHRSIYFFLLLSRLTEIKLFRTTRFMRKKKICVKIRQQIELTLLFYFVFFFFLDAAIHSPISPAVHVPIYTKLSNMYGNEWIGDIDMKFGDANGVWYWRECENDQIPFVPHVFYVPSPQLHMYEMYWLYLSSSAPDHASL